ncbi:MAG: hypothetical protein ACI3W5_05660 [Faecousia sp.]
MTILKDSVLWDNGIDRLTIFSIPAEQQYNYVDGIPCITFGILYENSNYRGCDTFSLFDHFYVEKVYEIKKAHCCLNGKFRIDDAGADTDGYIDFEMKSGQLSIRGQLGASFSTHSLMFEFRADQSLVSALLQALCI